MSKKPQTTKKIRKGNTHKKSLQRQAYRSCSNKSEESKTFCTQKEHLKMLLCAEHLSCQDYLIFDFVSPGVQKLNFALLLVVFASSCS